MSDFNTPMPTSLPEIVQLNIDSLKQLTALYNAQSAYEFDIAVKNAALGGNPAPTSYKVEVVNADKITSTLLGVPPYDTSGWFTTQDYTPPAPPLPPAPPKPVNNPVGGDNGGGWFLDTGLPGYGDGALWTDTRGTFKKVMRQSPFGVSVGWYKIS